MGNITIPHLPSETVLAIFHPTRLLDVFHLVITEPPMFCDAPPDFLKMRLTRLRGGGLENSTSSNWQDQGMLLRSQGGSGSG